MTRVPVPPTPLTGRLHERVPAAGARPTLLFLAVGHLCIAGATVALLVGGAVVDPVAGGVFVVAGQLLSFVEVCALARATTDHVDAEQIARSLRRSGWSFACTVLPAGIQWSLLAATATPQLFALFALLAGAVLLELVHLGRTLRAVGSGVEHHLLPVGTGPRTRALHSAVAATHAVLGGVGAVLLVATTVAVLGSAAATPLSGSIQIVAATAAAAVPLLPIRGILLARAAVPGDTVHVPGLRRAVGHLTRAGAAAVPLTAAAIASLPLAPTDPQLAAVACILAVVAIGITVTHLVELERFLIGDIPRRFGRRDPSPVR